MEAFAVAVTEEKKKVASLAFRGGSCNSCALLFCTNRSAESGVSPRGKNGHVVRVEGSRRPVRGLIGFSPFLPAACARRRLAINLGELSLFMAATPR